VSPDAARVGLVRTDAARGRAAEREHRAREPRDRLVFDGAAPVAIANATLPASPVRPLRRARPERADGRALEVDPRAGGALRRRARASSGARIGQFQIIQQELARLAGDVAARSWRGRAAFARRGARRRGGRLRSTFEIAAQDAIGEGPSGDRASRTQTHGAIASLRARPPLRDAPALDLARRVRIDAFWRASCG
jgi:hypothetical protein